MVTLLKNGKPCCTFPECRRKRYAKGICFGHYQQLWAGKELSPLYSRKRRDGTPPVIKYRVVPCRVKGLKGPCHQWTGAKTKGYG